MLPSQAEAPVGVPVHRMLVLVHRMLVPVLDRRQRRNRPI